MVTGTTTVCTIKMGKVDDEVQEVVQGILTSVVTIERELDVPLTPTKGKLVRVRMPRKARVLKGSRDPLKTIVT